MSQTQDTKQGVQSIDVTHLSIPELYHKLTFVYEDVGSDIGQPIIVDGDSILLDLVQDAQIDWSHGGQFLHLFYLAEERLQRIAESGRTLRVNFFRVLGDVWVQPLHKTIRSLLLNHLTQNSEFEVSVIDNWWCDEWASYLDETDPCFLLVSDGDKADEKGILAEGTAVYFQALTLQAISIAVEIVRSSEVSFQSKRMFGFQLGLNYDLLSQIRTLNLLDINGRIAPRVKPDAEYDSKTFEALSSDITEDSKLLWSAYCAAQILKEDSSDTNAFLSKALLAHAILLRNYPLRLRSLEFVDSQDDVSEFLENVFHKAHPVVGKLFDMDGGATGRVIDFVDARFLHQLVYHIRKTSNGNLGFSPSDQKALESTWSSVAACAGLADTKLGNDFASPEPCEIVDFTPVSAEELEELKAAKAQEIKERLADAPTGDIEAKDGSESKDDAEPAKSETPAAADDELGNWDDDDDEDSLGNWDDSASDDDAKEDDTKDDAEVAMGANTANDDADNDDKQDEVHIYDITPVETIDSPLMRLVAPYVHSKVHSDRPARGYDHTVLCIGGIFEAQTRPDDATMSQIRQDLIGNIGEKNIVTGRNGNPDVTVDIKIGGFFIRMINDVAADEAAEKFHGQFYYITRSNKRNVQHAASDHRELYAFVVFNDNDRIYMTYKWRNNAQMFELDGIPHTEIEENEQELKDKQNRTRLEKRRDKRKRMRNKQKYMDYMAKYAQSLKGGKIVLRDVIVAAPKAEKKEENKSSKKSYHKKKPKKGKKKLTVKEQAALEIEAKRLAREKEDIQILIRQADHESSLEQKISKLDEALLSDSRPSAVPGLLQLLEWALEAWKIEKLNSNMSAAIRVFQLIYDIERRFFSVLDSDRIQKLMHALYVLGFVDAAEAMRDKWLEANPECDGKAIEMDTSGREYIDYKVGSPCARFQLQHGGPFMIRDVESAPDPRVSGFYPDKWQRDLLDVVDSNESALVVAPTSSGKTFVSYYTMQRTLSENQRIRSMKSAEPTGVIVYVAPTKALVNQIAADLYNHYGPVYGVLVEKYNIRPVFCEVLITVPECLEYLLMDPSREEWANTIQYAIFDEVHCISEEGGDKWEHLLQLLPCPFLALSATVGNPAMFFSWLERVSHLREREVRLVTHKHRWSDLQKYMYLPQNEYVLSPSNRLDGADKGILSFELDKQSTALLPMHPCCALGTGAQFNASSSFPTDLAFSPSDALDLYDAMFVCLNAPDCKLTPELRERMADLKPKIFFGSRGHHYIGKREAREYETALKDELSHWIKCGVKESFQVVLSDVSRAYRARLEHMQTEAKEENCYDRRFMRNHFLSLLLELNCHEQLPAVIFCNDRSLCEEFVNDTLKILEDMEAKKLAEEGKDDKRIKKKKKKKKDKGTGNRKEDEENKRMGIVEAEESDDEDETVDSRFSFLKDSEKMDREDINYWMNRMLRKKEWSVDHPLIRAIYRGIGIHHDGLPRAYKDLVETLFRSKHLKVVIATKTLALGINMPCRTVVLAGNDKRLTPLTFRQMSGRAGRRGYDNVGHVVFFGVNPHKVSRLLKAPLTSLEGHYPVNASLTSRMVNRFRGSKDQSGTAESFRHYLDTSFFAHTSSDDPDRMSLQCGWNFRFMIEYLVRSDLLEGKDARPSGFAGLANFMHKHEPLNFTVITLLQTQLLQRVCQESVNNALQGSTNLLILLSYVLNRIVLPNLRPAHVTTFTVAGGEEKSFEDLLPEEPPIDGLTDILETHQLKTLDLLVDYLTTYAKMELTSKWNQVKINTLPVSQLQFPCSSESIKASPGSAVHELQASAQEFLVRSPFAASSGLNDEFESPSELNGVRSDVFLEAHHFPFPNHVDVQGRRLRLNSFAYDFYRHGDFKRLMRENYLQSSECWHGLNAWNTTLKNLTHSMELVAVTPDDDMVVKTFRYLQQKFTSQFEASERQFVE